MTYYYLFYILLLIIVIMLGWVVWILKRILRIMAMQNRGIPAASDMKNMSFEEMAKRKK